MLQCGFDPNPYGEFMLKLIVGFIMVVGLIGCKDENSDNNTVSKSQYKSLVEANNNLQRELSTCESKYNSLAEAVSSGQTNYNSKSEPEPEPERNCNEVEYLIIMQNNRKLDTCVYSDVKETGCGVSADNCESGYGYSCLRDISYKSITKEVCE